MESINLTKSPIQASNKPAKWLRSKHVRVMLNISDSTLQSMRITGAIKAYKLGSSWFYREDEIISALEAGSTKRKDVSNG